MDCRALGRWKVFATACAIGAATCSPVQAHAQTTVRGVVRAAGPTVEPIAGAVVVIVGQRDSARSSSNGKFEIRGVSAGNQSLSVRAIGYAPRTLNILVSSADGWTGSVELERLPQSLPGVEVTERPTFEFTTKYDGFFQRRKRGLGGTFRTHEDFEKSGASNMASALAGIPGVAVSTTVTLYSGAPEYRFRIARCPGNPPNIAVYIDGQLLLGVRERFSELMSSIVLTDVRYVEFYRGPGQIPSDIERGDNCAVLLIWMR